MSPDRSKTRVTITGSKGRIGSVLSESLYGYDLTSLDLPDFDALDYHQVIKATFDQDVVIHLAWNSIFSSSATETNHDCIAMYDNVYKACVENSVKRIIMASSVHAYPFLKKHAENPNLIVDPEAIERPAPLYAISKLDMEQQGRLIAEKYGIDVICLRLGAVFPEDLHPEDVRNPFNRLVLLRHNDLSNLISRCVDISNIKNNFTILNAVSDLPDRIHDVKNIVGWQPIPRKFEPRKSPLWFDSNQMLLLKIVLGNETEAVVSWKEWCARVYFDDIGNSSLHMMPAVHRRLVKIGLEHPLLPKLKGIHRRTWFANQFLFSRVVSVLKEMAQEGIDFVIIKGGGMLKHYDDIGLRPMHDVDILVNKVVVYRVIGLLDKLGWIAYPRLSLDQVKNTILKTDHAWAFSKNGATIDLHWHALHMDLSNDADSELWKNTIWSTLQDEPVKIPDPTHQLFITCIHGVRWEHTAKLTWVVDALILVNHKKRIILWDQLLQMCIDRRLVLPMKVCLQWLKSEFNAYIPDHVIAGFEAQRIGIGQLVEFRARSEPPQHRSSIKNFLVSHYGFYRSRDRKINRLVLRLFSHLIRYLQQWLRGNLNYNWRVVNVIGRKAPSIFVDNSGASYSVKPLEIDHWYECRQHGDGFEYLHQGWSPAEQNFTWTYQNQAKISFSVNPEVGQVLILRYAPYKKPGKQKALVDLWCDRTPLDRLETDTIDESGITTVIQKLPDDVVESGIRDIDLIMHNTGRPSDNTDTDDNRLLGICLYGFQVSPMRTLTYTPFVFNFRENSIDSHFAVSGWSEPEPAGTWSIGELAKLILPVGATRADKIAMSLKITPFIPLNKKNQNFIVSVNDETVLVEQFEHRGPETVYTEFACPGNIRNGMMNITFKILNPGKPSKNNESQDSRNLGIMLHSVSLNLIG